MDAPLAPHPSDQILLAYGLGKLGDPAASSIDLHLEGCAACRRRVSELSGDNSFLGRLRNAVARPEAPSRPAPVPASNHPGPAPAAGSDKAAAAKAPDPALAGKLPPELADNEQYAIIKELGRGGMGIVYLARNLLLDRMEVLKVLNTEMLERKGTYQRFLREIRAAARLDHPNVVKAYSAQRCGKHLVFAMEYIKGHDLSKLVRARGALPVSLSCSFIHQAALGLQHAHERGMVHRDIKPGNLMYMQQGKAWVVKILDFGLAKATQEQGMDGSLTREGQMLGTVDYIAPEQALDAQGADIRADIYSLGCTMYYLLSGGPPFEGSSLARVLLAHQQTEARPLNLLRPEVPVELAAVVARMMAKEPQRRYQTPAEVAEALVPFFKPWGAGSGSADGERAAVAANRPAEAAPAPDPVPAPPQSVGPVITPSPTPAPAQEGLKWESLITVEQPEGLTEPKAKSAVSGLTWPGHPRTRIVLAVGGFLVLLIMSVVGLFKLMTPESRPLPKRVPGPGPSDGFVALLIGSWESNARSARGLHGRHA